MARIPITAFAVCNALGADTEAVIRGLESGQAAVGHKRFADTDACMGVVAVEPTALSGSLAPYDTRQGRLAAHVAGLVAEDVGRACRRWGAKRVGVIVGTSTGGIGATERAFEHWLREATLPDDWDLSHRHSMQATVEVVKRVTGARGPAYAVSTACSSSGKVLASAQRLIEHDVVDAVVAGGIDTLCAMTLRGFASLEVASPEPCKPFSVQRRGINVGEGGALLLLERASDAEVDLVAVGESSDAHHISAPHPEGLGARLAMQRALDEAKLDPRRVGHVNAHATATPSGDVAEARAIAAVFGSSTPVVATKGYIGHLLGAAGATEVIFTAIAIERGWLPASIGCDPIDPNLEIRVITDRLDIESDYAVSNSFAFGGSNVAVLLGARIS